MKPKMMSVDIGPDEHATWKERRNDLWSGGVAQKELGRKNQPNQRFSVTFVDGGMRVAT